MTLKQKNIFMPLIIVGAVSLYALLSGQAPLSAIVVVMALAGVVSYCLGTEKSFLLMLLLGFAVTAVLVLIIVGLAFLARESEIAEQIITFPVYLFNK